MPEPITFPTPDLKLAADAAIASLAKVYDFAIAPLAKVYDFPVIKGQTVPGDHQGHYRDHDVPRASCTCTEDVWAETFTVPCPRHEFRAYVKYAKRRAEVSA